MMENEKKWVAVELNRTTIEKIKEAAKKEHKNGLPLLKVRPFLTWFIEQEFGV